MDKLQLVLDEEALNAVLCYVEGDWAYFTTRPLDQQRGDDWHKATYEYNASPPLSDGSRIIKLAYYGDFETPASGYQNSPFSVNQINAGAVAWLRSPPYAERQVHIPAGTSLRDFVRLIRQAGWSVYAEVEPAPL